MNKHYLYYIIFFCLIFQFISAQSIHSDRLQYLKKSEKQQLIFNKPNLNKKKSDINFFIRFYQKHISVQISANCVYHPSCSNYSAEFINKHGFILGLLATADRISRCNALAMLDIPEYKFNAYGKANDKVK